MDSNKGILCPVLSDDLMYESDVQHHENLRTIQSFCHTLGHYVINQRWILLNELYKGKDRDKLIHEFLFSKEAEELDDGPLSLIK